MDDIDRYLEDSDIYRRYPDLYRRLYPKVSDCLERYIREKGEDWEPTDSEIEDMTDEIYDRMKRECPEIDEDLDERKYWMSNVDAMQRPFYGRRRLTRDLIAIILLGSLLSRRRRRRRRFYDYLGYGYGLGHWY
ncbi:hypothetical protein DW1_0769 [Proteiniborus sp. DW1]|uniref:hypothetical protein n=1 Tax=Proteiniborus sp. DW1 TaxID=1889883 RepID=UPI00092DFE34|nr:hypothetical protein [Proteiniborus sp. DW1]SCG82377.1 hypothetical protein DW1_0769 [Proteiniborus sp. DW1]